MNIFPGELEVADTKMSPGMDTKRERRTQIYLLVADFLRANGLDEAAQMVCASHEAQVTRPCSFNWLGNVVAESSSQRVQELFTIALSRHFCRWNTRNGVKSSRTLKSFWNASLPRNVAGLDQLGAFPTLSPWPINWLDIWSPLSLPMIAKSVNLGL